MISRRSLLPFLLYPSLSIAQKADEAEYKSLKELWEDLTYNRIKRKRLMDPNKPVIVSIFPVRAFMVLEGDKDTAGRLVVTDLDDGERPSVVAYIYIPIKMQKNSPPLEDVRKGDRMGVMGVIFATAYKGTSKGENRAANTINIAFGRFGHISEK
jgi:hypothetical protein